MADGPFRNAELSARWKKYGEVVMSDASSKEERAAQACHSILGDINLKEISSIIREIKNEASRPQMTLDPIILVDEVFEGRKGFFLVDEMYRFLTAEVTRSARLDVAADRALVKTIHQCIEGRRDRMEHEWLAAETRGDITKSEFAVGCERSNEVFCSIDVSALKSAIENGTAKAFAPTARKKGGIDEGPEE